MHSRKGQLEIMGLAVVVILLSLVFLFVIQFVILRPPEEIKETFTREQIAQGTVDVLALTTTECKGLKMRELVQDCARAFPEFDCNGVSSCNFVENVVRDRILDKTLTAWQRDYNFTIADGGEHFVSFTGHGGGCLSDRDVGFVFIPPREGNDKIVMRLEVCGS